MSGAEPKWPTGFEIRPRVETLSDADLAAFAGVPTAHASDCLGRSVGALGLNPYHGDGQLVGRAVTVRARPGDNLMIHKAVRMAKPGDVIVVDGAGDLTQALIGGLMRVAAQVRGVAGFVIDGAIRDVVEFREGGLACFAKGVVHRGPSKTGPGEINVPISCAGMAVAPGDLILGDPDGVLCVPAAQVAGLLPLVKAHAAKEDKIRAGSLALVPDDERFNEILRAAGVPAAFLEGL